MSFSQLGSLDHTISNKLRTSTSIILTKSQCDILTYCHVGKDWVLIYHSNLTPQPSNVKRSNINVVHFYSSFGGVIKPLKQARDAA
jgi:hypothetical protein